MRTTAAERSLVTIAIILKRITASIAPQPTVKTVERSQRRADQGAA
jgi:hypothetical protein